MTAPAEAPDFATGVRYPQLCAPVLILRWVDDEPQPGIVEFVLRDAHGKEHFFIDKTAYVGSDGDLEPSSTYPMDGSISVRRIGDPRFSQTAHIETLWLESKEGVSRFEVPTETLFVEAWPTGLVWLPVTVAAPLPETPEGWVACTLIDKKGDVHTFLERNAALRYLPWVPNQTMRYPCQAWLPAQTVALGNEDGGPYIDVSTKALGIVSASGKTEFHMEQRQTWHPPRNGS